MPQFSVDASFVFCFKHRYTTNQTNDLGLSAREHVCEGTARRAARALSSRDERTWHVNFHRGLVGGHHLGIDVHFGGGSRTEGSPKLSYLT